MHAIFSREPDPLDSILRPQSPPENEPLRQAVYTRTRRVLHRRHRLRQFAYAASLLLSFAAGAGAMRMAIFGERGRVSAPRGSLEESFGESLVVSALGALTRPRSPELDDSALAAEWIAFDSTERRSDLYRQAGDRYMTEEKDLESALRCYRNALDSGTEQDLAISPDDNWLLMIIKNARQKEKKYAKQGG